MNIARIAFLLTFIATSAMAIEQCGSGKRYTCVVDGDTIWYRGEKIRLKSYDTPETSTNLCGGERERQLGRKATARLVKLLNSGGVVTLERDGSDRYQRTLATLYLDGKDVGDILIEMGLARRWPDGPEFWCER